MLELLLNSLMLTEILMQAMWVVPLLLMLLHLSELMEVNKNPEAEKELMYLTFRERLQRQLRRLAKLLRLGGRKPRPNGQPPTR